MFVRGFQCRSYSLDSPWVHVAKFFIGESKNILYLGSQWAHERAYQMSNLFWKDVFIFWGKFLEKSKNLEKQMYPFGTMLIYQDILCLNLYFFKRIP